MDGKKVEMTDEEIVKALECCAVEPCEDCGNCPRFTKEKLCHKANAKQSLDLINRQKAEIERLNGCVLKYAETLGNEQRKSAELQKQVDELKELSEGYFKKAYFYYQKCKAYGIENFYDDELEPKPAKEGKTITIPKFEHIEVE